MAISPFEQMAAEAAADTSRIPSDDGAKRLSSMATRMVQLQQEIRDLEEQTKRKNEQLWDLQTRQMPDLFAEIGTDSVGVPTEDGGYDVELGTRTHAAILSDWPDEKKEAAFEHLDELGAGDLVNNIITVSFPRGHDRERREWLEKVRGLNLDFDPPSLVESRAVPWNTLTAWIKGLFRDGKAQGLDLEKLGATHTPFATIKKRK